jgi:hypothetical protein
MPLSSEMPRGRILGNQVSNDTHSRKPSIRFKVFSETGLPLLRTSRKLGWRMRPFPFGVIILMG